MLDAIAEKGSVGLPPWYEIILLKTLDILGEYSSSKLLG